MRCGQHEGGTGLPQRVDEAGQVLRLVLAVRVHRDDDVVAGDVGGDRPQPEDDRPLVAEPERRRQHGDVGVCGELRHLVVRAGRVVDDDEAQLARPPVGLAGSNGLLVQTQEGLRVAQHRADHPQPAVSGRDSGHGRRVATATTDVPNGQARRVAVVSEAIPWPSASTRGASWGKSTCSRGALRNRRATQQREQLREQVRHRPDLEAGGCEDVAQRAAGVTAVVAELGVPRGERPLHRRHRDHQRRGRAPCARRAPAGLRRRRRCARARRAWRRASRRRSLRPGRPRPTRRTGARASHAARPRAPRTSTPAQGGWWPASRRAARLRHRGRGWRRRRRARPRARPARSGSDASRSRAAQQALQLLALERRHGRGDHRGGSLLAASQRRPGHRRPLRER